MLVLRAELAACAGVRAGTVARAKKREFGDNQINAAMQLAKAEKKPPREIAQRIVDAVKDHAAIAKAEIAGPGFVNIFVRDQWLAANAGTPPPPPAPAGRHPLPTSSASPTPPN